MNFRALLRICSMHSGRRQHISEWSTPSNNAHRTPLHNTRQYRKLPLDLQRHGRPFASPRNYPQCLALAGGLDSWSIFFVETQLVIEVVNSQLLVQHGLRQAVRGSCTGHKA